MILKNVLFYFAGIVFLVLAKTKNILQGYSSPKPFNISEIERCIEYDINVVDKWLLYLKEYTRCSNFITNKNILELGPGSDLGAGLYLLSKGGSKYNTCDVNDLMRFTSDSFYEQLFNKLKSIVSNADVVSLEEEFNKFKCGSSSRLNYLVRKDLDIVSAFGGGSVDLVFSQAVFEHFDNIDATIEQMSVVCKPGAILVTEIDLHTHSRYIRDKDPNNIYRYHRAVYNAFWFRGMPNRVRPFQYKEMLQRHGWENIVITPLLTLNDTYKKCSGLSKDFIDEKNQMNYLSIMICARKK